MLLAMRRRAVLTALSLAAIAAIGLVDLASGPDYGFSLFYMLVVAYAAWFLGRWPGVLCSLAGAGMWLFADVATHQTTPIVASVWNGFTRLVMFLVIAVLLDRVRISSERLREVDKEREEFLAVLERELPGPVEGLAALTDRLGRANGAPEAALVDEIRRGVADLRFLAREFVSLGDLQHRRITLERSEVDAGELVRGAVAGIEGRDRIVFTLPTGPVRLSADADRLRLAIAGVVRSALQHSTDYVTIAVDTDAAETSFDVTDRGRVAIAPGAVGAYPVAGERGTPRAAVMVDRVRGLQLARLIVQAHGGSLVVEGHGPRLGSTVRIRIPR